MELNFNIDWQTILDGLLIAVVGYLVVLIALACLYFVFRYVPVLLHSRIRARLLQQGKLLHKDDKLILTGDESAAIATALYLFLSEVHDEENTAVTIKKISKRYSPWSSKIFGVMDHLRH